ncbi:MAG TPA: hypothetical protein VFS00_15815 [Polyangiaceae bacterium]|nr:hypothetical protein [Polyangiaceae bacterium]
MRLSHGLRPSPARGSAFAGALALALIAPSGRAEAPKAEGYAFGWTRLPGAEACIGARELSGNVEKALGRPAFVAASKAERSIEGSVAPRPGGGWSASVQLSDARGSILGTRELTSDGPDCRALDESLTLSITLLVDPDASPAMMPGGWVERGKPKAPKGGEPAAANEPAAAEETAAPAPSKKGRTAKEGSPEQRAAPPPAAAKLRDRREVPEISVHGGYVTGDQIFPVEGSFGDGLGFGAGARAGYVFRSGLWLGGSYTFYRGGEFSVPDDHLVFPVMFMDGVFHAHVAGPELGYSFSLGPFEARPYVGLGLAVFDFTRHYRQLEPNVYGESSTQPSPTSLDGGGPLLRVSTWPGFALSLPLGESFFVGADARWAVVFGAPSNNNVGLFATAGWRF